MDVKTATAPGHGFKCGHSSATGQRLCRWCDKPFDPKDWRQEFCAKPCKVKWFAWWNGKGASLATALYAYRYQRKPGALSDLCNLFADYVADYERKKKQ